MCIIFCILFFKLSIKNYFIILEIHKSAHYRNVKQWTFAYSLGATIQNNYPQAY